MISGDGARSWPSVIILPSVTRRMVPTFHEGFGRKSIFLGNLLKSFSRFANQRASLTRRQSLPIKHPQGRPHVAFALPILSSESKSSMFKTSPNRTYHKSNKRKQVDPTTCERDYSPTKLSSCKPWSGTKFPVAASFRPAVKSLRFSVRSVTRKSK